MKTLCVGLMVLSLVSSFAADPNPAADSEWAEILKNSKPPTPPAEWNQKPPTPEQMAEFKKKVGDAAEVLAEKAKKFYEAYPDHPKASEAQRNEKKFRQQAAALRTVKEEKKDEPEVDAGFKAKYLEAIAKIRQLRSEGPPAVAAELEKSGRALGKEFPKQAEPWQMLMTAAQYAEATKAAAIYKEVAENATDPQMKQAARAELKNADRLNKPIEIAFKSTDGKEIDISKMKGKVVLVDFWATWCGPCVAELPNVKRAYEELNPQGFEILGISFDNDCDDLTKFVAQKKMPWAQFCEGTGWKNSIGQEFGIRSIPAMYLVDKKGVLRDMDGRKDLVEKVKKLLAE